MLELQMQTWYSVKGFNPWSEIGTSHMTRLQDPLYGVVRVFHSLIAIKNTLLNISSTSPSSFAC